MIESIREVTAEALNDDDFYQDHLKIGVPILLRGALDQMPARLWTPEMLANRFGHKSFTMNRRSIIISEMVEQFFGSEAEQRKAYLTNVNVSVDFPEIIDDLTNLPSFVRGNWRSSRLVSRVMGYGGYTCQFFMGAKGSGFPFLHVDYPPMHTFSALFYGDKEWMLLPPQIRLMHSMR